LEPGCVFIWWLLLSIPVNRFRETVEEAKKAERHLINKGGGFYQC
jgi:hypothetical protein